jgi:hypothetical protein
MGKDAAAVDRPYLKRGLPGLPAKRRKNLGKGK